MRAPRYERNGVAKPDVGTANSNTLFFYSFRTVFELFASVLPGERSNCVDLARFKLLHFGFLEFTLRSKYVQVKANIGYVYVCNPFSGL